VICALSLGISVEALAKILILPLLHSVSTTLCRPVSLTLLILTLIPLSEKLINSGLIPNCVLLKFVCLILVLLGIIFLQN
jgi:hypothetical protein